MFYHQNKPTPCTSSTDLCVASIHTHTHTLRPLSKQIFLWTQLGHHCYVDKVDIVAVVKIDLLCRPTYPTVSMGYVVVAVPLFEVIATVLKGRATSAASKQGQVTRHAIRCLHFKICFS